MKKEPKVIPWIKTTAEILTHCVFALGVWQILKFIGIIRWITLLMTH